MQQHKNMGDTDPMIAILQRELITVSYGAEVGVHRGETSAKLLHAFPALHLYLVDEWGVYKESHRYRKSGDGCSKFSQAEQDANLLATRKAVDFARERATIIRAPSVEAGEQFRGPNINGRLLDFAFIDADHTYEAVRDDILAWWPNVKSEGLLIGHDIDHPRDKRGIWGVRRAVEEFAEHIGQKPHVMGEVWWLRKDSEEE